MVVDKTQDSTGCEVCTLVATELDSLLSKDSTEAEIEAALEKVCGLLPSSYESECDTLVQEYGQTIVQLLIKELAPEKICKEVGLCTENMVVADKSRDSTECDVCKLVAKELDSLLSKDSTEKEIKAALDKVCSILPSAINSECTTLVNEYGDAIIQLLIQELAPDQICSELKLCEQNYLETTVNELQSSTKCDICTFISKDLDDVITKDSTEAQIQEALQHVCGVLPNDLKSECNNLVNEFGHLIVQLLAKELSPNQICMQLKLCEDDCLKLQGEPCGDCKNFVGDLQSLINNKSPLVQQITDLVNNECGQLGPGLGDACKSFVDQYAPVLENALIGTDSDTICSTIMMCEGVPSRNFGGDICTDCTAFVSDWQYIIINNQSTINSINSLIAGECQNLGPSFSKLCDTAAKQYLPQLWSLLSSVDPEEACNAAYFCDMTQAEEKISESVVEVQGQPCGDCKNFIGDLQSLINSGSGVMQEIVDLITQECGQLGPGLSDTCKSFVYQYAPVIGMAIISTDSDTICSTIMMCQGTCSENLGGDICADCTAFFNDWQSFVMNNKTIIDNVNSLISGECDDLPPEYSQMCTSVVKDYLPQLWNLIVSVDAGDACNAAYFCDLSEEAIEPPVEEHTEVQSSYCGDCKNFIGDLQDNIKTNPSLVQEVVDLVKQECDELGPAIGDVCKKMVDQYAPDVENAITGNDAGLICSTLDMCTGSSQKAGTGDLCSDCQTFLGDWQQIIMNNQSILNDISSKVKQQCSSLGSEFQKLCESTIQEYLPQLWDAITSSDPEEACAAVYFCDLNKHHLMIEKDDPEAGELECNACKFAIEEVEKMVGENKSEENIAQALTVVCDLYGEDIRAECKSFIEQYGDDVIDFIILEMNSFEICNKLGLCKSGLKKTKQSKKVASDTECDVCNLVITEVYKVVTSQSTEKEILNALESICSHIGKAAQECDMIVHEYGPTLISMITQKLSPSEICSLVKLCKSKTQVATVSSDLNCEVCQIIADELDKLLKEDSTKAGIQAALNKVCGIIPSTYKDTCISLISQYTPEIVALLVSEMEPATICPQLKLCSSISKKMEESDVECKLCSLMAKEVDGLLKEGSTQAEIKDTLRKVCGILPSDFKFACNNLIAQGSQMIIDELIKGMEPQAVCKYLKMCPAKNDLVKMSPAAECDVCQLVALGVDILLTRNFVMDDVNKALSEFCHIVPKSAKDTCLVLIQRLAINVVILTVEELNPSAICPDLGYCQQQSVEAVQSSEFSCEVCKFVATELNDLEKDNYTKAEVKEVVTKICDALGGSLKEKCNSFVTKYSDVIAEILAAEVSPSHLCPALGLCPKQVEQIRSVAECDVCKIVMKELKTMISKESTEHDVLNAVSKVCSLVPGQYRSVCDEYIKDYGPGVVSILVDDFVPDKVCVTLGLCRNAMISYPPRKLHIGASDRCPICRSVIQTLDGLLEQNATQAKIEKGLQKVCNFMPTSEVTECDSLIEEFFPTIMQYAQNIFDPSFICQHLKLCPTKELALECMQGPLFWCQNMATAAKCNAISHCMDHVWDTRMVQ